MAAEVGDESLYQDRSELFAFVWQRSEQTLATAERSGDELRARFARRSLAILTAIRVNLDEGRSIGDLMAARFLRRLAQDYREHPEFHDKWRLDDR